MKKQTLTGGILSTQKNKKLRSLLNKIREIRKKETGKSEIVQYYKKLKDLVD